MGLGKANDFTPGSIGEVVDCDFLNVRAKVGPNKYDVVKGDQLRVGTRVQLLGYENFRYRIVYNGKDGYIYEKYVRLI